MTKLRGRIILIILRFICLALLMIAVSLVLPDLRLGGRYWILLEAAVIALLAPIIRNLLETRIFFRGSCLLNGFSIVAVLFMTKKFFPGVNLSFMGILLLYFGDVLLEIMLPERIKVGIWRSE